MREKKKKSLGDCPQASLALRKAKFIVHAPEVSEREKSFLLDFSPLKNQKSPVLKFSNESFIEHVGEFTYDPYFPFVSPLVPCFAP